MQSLLEAHTGGLLQANYRAQGQQALNARQQAVQQLLSQRQLPAAGWSDLSIQSLLADIAAMDSNNFTDSVGVGEREGRVFSSLVQSRHLHLSHGMGRSGDLLAQQPKAVGSSLLLTLTHALTLHAVKLAGLTEAKRVLLLPVATGMSLVLALTAIRQQHPSVVRAHKAALQHAQQVAQSKASASDASVLSSMPPLPPPPAVASSSPLYVIWSRIDQKTCLKSLFAADLVPVVVELRREGDALVTDVDAIERAILAVGAENIAAVVSTTSCFAPRHPDKVIEIAQLCARFNLPHVVNNAYGLQSASTCALLNSAVRRRGRIDCVVSSLDKNFLVPVGGAVVIGFRDAEKNKSAQAAPNKPAPAAADGKAANAAAPSSTPAASTPSSSAAPSPPLDVLSLISSLYPGRASSSSILDLFITLLSMGAEGWNRLLREREQLMPRFRQRMEQWAHANGERLLHTPDNPISFAITLDSVTADTDSDADHSSSSADASSSPSPAPAVPSSAASLAAVPSKFVPSYLGSLLFSRHVSGPRVLSPATPASTIHSLRFDHYGTHCASYPHAYITAACAIGMREEEVELFATRLDKCVAEFRKQKQKAQRKQKQTPKPQQQEQEKQADAAAASEQDSAQK